MAANDVKLRPPHAHTGRLPVPKSQTRSTADQQQIPMFGLLQSLM